MTNNEVIEVLEKEESYMLSHGGDRQAKALRIAIDKIKQESILDKIRAEIMDTGALEQEVMGYTEFLAGINYCLGVIDKYKAESEG
jgi:hypothetical protein